MKNIKTTAFALAMLALLTFSTTSAATMGSLNVQAADMAQKDQDLQIAFSIENISGVKQSLQYGLRLQKINSDEVYEVPIGTISIEAGENRVEDTTVTIPTKISGIYDVFILSRDNTGLVDVLKYIGTATINKSHQYTDEYTEATLSNCTLQEQTSTITCGIENATKDTIDVNYAVHQGSIYGDILTQGISNNVEVDANNTISITVSDMLTGGAYTYRLWLADEMLGQNVVIDMPEGTTVAESSSSSVFMGLYDKYKTIVILIPIVLLLLLLSVALRKPNNTTLESADASHPDSNLPAGQAGGASTPSTKPNGTTKTTAVALLIGIGLSAGIASASMTLADIQPLSYIFNGFTKDSNKEQFAIRLDQVMFEESDPIGLTVVFQETALPNNKPSGGSIDYNLDGGSWFSLIAPTDTGSITHKNLPVIGVEGVHTLNFRSPDLCGSAFDFSVFDVALFGSTECLFSIPVTVVADGSSTDGGDMLDIGDIFTPGDGETVYNIGITALPPLIPTSGLVDISWSLTNANVTQCTIEGVDTNTDTVVDSWDWSVVNASNTRQSSVLTHTTIYTLDCTFIDDTSGTASVTVTKIPTWQEL